MTDADPVGMPLTLSPDVQDMVRRHLASGRFTDVDHVLLAAVAALDDAMRIEDEVLSQFAPGGLTAMIEESERSGPALDGEAVFAQLRARGAAALASVAAGVR